MRIITSNSDKLFIGVNIDNLEWPWTPKIGVLVFFCNLWLRRSFQQWTATKGIEIDQDNLRIGTAKAVARLRSFSQITCYNTFETPTFLHAHIANLTDSSLGNRTIATKLLFIRIKDNSTCSHLQKKNGVFWWRPNRVTVQRHCGNRICPCIALASRISWLVTLFLCGPSICHVTKS